jgi:membrane protease YdiL (CAAX protease family)
MKLNKTNILYLFGLLSVVLSILFPTLAWLSPFTYVVVSPIAAIWIWKSEGLPWIELGFPIRKNFYLWWIGGIAIGLTIPIGMFVMERGLGWIILSPRDNSTIGFLSYSAVLLVKMFFLVAIEELVFRGFFLQELTRKNGILFAVISSSVLWGFGHLASMVSDGLTTGQMLIGMTTFTLWGMALSVAFSRAGKMLWLPYGIHLGINISFSTFGWFYHIQPDAPQWWLGNPAWAPESGMIGIILWFVILLFFIVFTGRKKIIELKLR